MMQDMPRTEQTLRNMANLPVLSTLLDRALFTYV
jgi:hypothetical protein